MWLTCGTASGTQRTAYDSWSGAEPCFYYGIKVPVCSQRLLFYPAVSSAQLCLKTGTGTALTLITLLQPNGRTQRLEEKSISVREMSFSSLCVMNCCTLASLSRTLTLMEKQPHLSAITHPAYLWVMHEWLIRGEFGSGGECSRVPWTPRLCTTLSHPA